MTASTICLCIVDSFTECKYCSISTVIHLSYTSPEAVERFTNFSLIGRRGPINPAGSISNGICGIDEILLCKCCIIQMV